MDGIRCITGVILTSVASYSSVGLISCITVHYSIISRQYSKKYFYHDVIFQVEPHRQALDAGCDIMVGLL